MAVHWRQLKTSEVSSGAPADKVVFLLIGSGQGLSGWFAGEIASEGLRGLVRPLKLTLVHG